MIKVGCEMSGETKEVVPVRVQLPKELAEIAKIRGVSVEELVEAVEKRLLLEAKAIEAEAELEMVKAQLEMLKALETANKIMRKKEGRLTELPSLLYQGS